MEGVVNGDGDGVDGPDAVVAVSFGTGPLMPLIVGREDPMNINFPRLIVELNYKERSTLPDDE